MGLTIHYQLKSDTSTAKEARRLVSELRKRALDLPFAEVGEVTELKGDACDYQGYDGNDPLRWLAIQAGQHVVREDVHYSVKPRSFRSRRGHEGPGFYCVLWVDGVKGAEAIDQGDGGPVHWRGSARKPGGLSTSTSPACRSGRREPSPGSPR